MKLEPDKNPELFGITKALQSQCVKGGLVMCQLAHELIWGKGEKIIGENIVLSPVVFSASEAKKVEKCIKKILKDRAANT